ncbi:unnamed protein product, partial [Discosporangium mesarthrocarpum]
RVVETIALAAGIAWASGINVYATVALLGILGATGLYALPADLDPLTSPLVIGVALLLFVVEFFADKVPGLDTVWDTLQTFVRIPAGVLLALGAIGEVDTATQVAAALAAGTLTGATHATKAGTRAVINTSPEPFSNWAASFAEDFAVIAGVWVALFHPVTFLVLLGLFVLLMIWLLPKIWRGVRGLVRALGRLFGGHPPSRAEARDLAEP